MTLPTYASLTTINRGAPCQEYPGEWGIYLPPYLQAHWTAMENSRLGHPEGSKIRLSYPTYDSALRWAKGFLCYLEEQKTEYNPTDISICWKCSDNDPRIGQVWFTPFYCAGKFDIFGQYRST